MLARCHVGRVVVNIGEMTAMKGAPEPRPGAVHSNRYSKMATLFIVRHGQASFGDAHYDRLSTLGRQQSRWLGEYFAERGIAFCHVVAGELARQRDTAIEILAGMGGASDQVNTHLGLNEYDGEAVYAAHTGRGDQHLHQKADYKDYWRTFRAAYEAWVDDRFPDIEESWSGFGERVRQALEHACEGTSREEAILVVTSGGVIGRVVSELLGCAPRTAIELNFQFRNTAFCEVIVGSNARRLLSYNSIPHLDRPGRREAITHM